MEKFCGSLSKFVSNGYSNVVFPFGILKVYLIKRIHSICHILSLEAIPAWAALVPRGYNKSCHRLGNPLCPQSLTKP